MPAAPMCWTTSSRATALPAISTGSAPGWARPLPDRVPRHAFGVMQPDDEAITAIAAWYKGHEGKTTVSFVPIIGHFECRDACMTRLRAQPEQLRP